MVMFDILLQHFFYVKIILTIKTDNLSYKYSNQYIIKFINFMLINYIINLDIILFYIIFNYLYLKYIDLLRV